MTWTLILIKEALAAGTISAAIFAGSAQAMNVDPGGSSGAVVVNPGGGTSGAVAVNPGGAETSGAKLVGDPGGGTSGSVNDNPAAAPSGQRQPRRRNRRRSERQSRRRNVRRGQHRSWRIEHGRQACSEGEGRTQGQARQESGRQEEGRHEGMYSQLGRREPGEGRQPGCGALSMQPKGSDRRSVLPRAGSASRHSLPRALPPAKRASIPVATEVRRCGSNGFVRYARAPRAIPLASVSREVSPERKMIGMPAVRSSRRSAAASRKPSSTGIDTSVMTRSGIHENACVRPCWPSGASRTMMSDCCKQVAHSARIAGSSSTTSTSGRDRRTAGLACSGCNSARPSLCSTTATPVYRMTTRCAPGNSCPGATVRRSACPVYQASFARACSSSRVDCTHTGFADHQGGCLR